MIRTRNGEVISPARRRGFSLVELMAVVGIIILLLTILTPAITKIRLSVLVSKTQSRINLIGGACEMYRSDFGEFPVDAKDLVQNLTGKDDDEGPDGDGHAGFGFRVDGRGRVFGPYNGTEKLDTFTVTDEDDPAFEAFEDSFRQPILYFRCTITGTGENKEFEYEGEITDENGTQQVKDYLMGPDELFRKDFVLISKGPNGEWDRYYNSGSGEWTDSDDVANYGQR